MSVDNFEFMWNKLPSVMKQENTEKFYKSVAKIFDDFDITMALYDKVHVIDFATGNYLNDLGEMLNVPREQLNDNQYRRKIKIFYYTYYFVPNLNNFLFLINNIMGYFPEHVLEGYNKAINPESGLLEIDVVIPPGADDSLLVDLDKIYGAGCRLDWNKIQEAYAVYHTTSDNIETGIDKPYDNFDKIRIGETLGIKASRSTGEDTDSLNPYDEFEI